MTILPLTLVNVFTDGTIFGGNPLVIFAHANLDDDTMQAIARQMNLNETVFITDFDEKSHTVDRRQHHHAKYAYGADLS